MQLNYPLKMYYVDFDFKVPTISEQTQIVEEYKSYMQTIYKQENSLDEGHITVVAMKALLSSLKQEAYFKGVRDIVRHLHSGIRTPDELFTSMFPDREDLVYLFKQQFFDACELLSSDIQEVDFEKLGLEIATGEKFDFTKLKNILKSTKEDDDAKD